MSRMRRRVRLPLPRPSVALLALGTLGLAACGDLNTLPASTEYGLVHLDATSGSAPLPLSARALFYEGTGLLLPADPPSPDVCTTVDNDSSALVEPLLPYVDAGTSVPLRLGATTVSLAPSVGDSGRTVYLPAGGASPSIAPGDSVSVTTPGVAAGFPPLSVASVMPDSFAFQPVDTGYTGEGIDLRWTPAPGSAPGTLMRVHLRYATAGSATLDKETYCVLSDDGSFTVPPELTWGWGHAYLGKREFQASRTRLAVTGTAGAVLAIYSTLSTPPVDY